MKTTVDIINDFAIEAVCPNNLKPETVYEVTMVKLFKEFGIKLVDKLVAEGNLTITLSRPEKAVRNRKSNLCAAHVR